jgi:MFS family permease
LNKKAPFVSIWIATFVGMAGIAMVSPLLPIFAKEMGASGIWLGLSFSGFAISQTLLIPFVGRLSDKFGKKIFIAAGLAVYALISVGYAYAPTYQVLVLLRVISGVGTAMLLPSVFAYIGELSPPGHEGRYMGLLNVAFLMGFGIGPALGGTIKDAFSTDATFYAMGLLSAAAFIIILVFLPGRTLAEKQSSEEEKRVPFSVILRDNTVRGILSFQLVWALTYGAVLSFLAVFMTTRMGSTTTQVGITLSIRAAVNGVFAYPFGYLADRVNRRVLVTLGAVVAACGIFLIPWVGSFTAMLALFAIVGLFESVTVPAVNAITVEKGRELGMGSVMGIFNMAMGAGMMLGGIAGGLIVELTGIDGVFRFAAVMAVVGVLAFNFFVRRPVMSESPNN